MPIRKHRFRRKSKPGAVPGTVVESHAHDTKVHVIAFSSDELREFECGGFAEAMRLANNFSVVWIDLVGLANIKLLQEFGKLFDIHNLTLEDVVNVHQRPKFETFNKYRYVVTRMVSQDPEIRTEQISIFQAKNFVITFQERPGDCLGPLRERIRRGKGIVRNQQTDYLVYAILDSVFDHYFPVVDWVGDQLDAQDETLMNGSQFCLRDIHRLRSSILELRRWLRPNRELLNQLIRDESNHISKDTKVHLRDCYDHVIQLQESIESYREVCSDLRDFHLSAVSNKTNEVMKTLTIVSTIFIPLSFLAGLYGMNFEVMPELHWRYSYFVLLAVMAAIVVGFFVWFRRRGWF